MTVRWEELTEEERGFARGLKSKPGPHIDCGNGGAPRGAWPGPARIWRNRHQRCGTRVDLETAGNFFPAGAESSLDLSWGISVPVLAFAPPARFHLSCSLPMRRFAKRFKPDTLGELRLGRKRIKVDDRTAHERSFSLGDSDARRLPEPRAVSGSEQRCTPDAVGRPRKHRTVLCGRGSGSCWLSRLSALPAALRSWRPAAGSLKCIGASVWERLTPRCIDEDRRRERGRLAQEAFDGYQFQGNLGPRWTCGS